MPSLPPGSVGGMWYRDTTTSNFVSLLQGASATEIPRLREEIAAFTELGEHPDLHVGAYSSGMRVRLAFAISTALDPYILVIDEIFAAGDAAFIKKAAFASPAAGGGFFLRRRCVIITPLRMRLRSNLCSAAEQI